MMRAVGYIRVSTQEQADSGLSLEGQEKRIRAYCEAKAWQLEEVIVDAGESGSNTNRPGLQRVRDMVRRREVEVVVVLKLDRLTRSVKDLGILLEELEKTQVAFSSVTDNFDTTTANGRLVMNVLASVAQWERDIIVERTTDALAVKKSRHERVGAVPFGFSLAKDGKGLEPVPEQLATVEQIATMRREGIGLNAIARALNAAEVATAQGGRWAAKTIRGIVRNSLYSGVVPHFTQEGVVRHDHAA